MCLASGFRSVSSYNNKNLVMSQNCKIIGALEILVLPRIYLVKGGKIFVYLYLWYI